MLTLPATYFGHDLRTHVTQRVKTQQIARLEPTAANPTVLEGFALATLEGEKRPFNPDAWNTELENLYRALIDAKIFTVAKPMVVIWNADAFKEPIDWSIGVPVLPDTAAVPPLRLRRVPTIKAYHKTGPARDLGGDGSGSVQDKRQDISTFWSMLKIDYRKLPVRPRIVIFAFPGFFESPLNEESILDFIVGEPDSGSDNSH